MSETATETEMRTQTYRVFQHDTGNHWIERDILSGEGRYGYQPTAQELGRSFGFGEFLLVEISQWGSARFVVVVAETRYREQRDEEEGEGYVVEL